jgi:hypothetical protein
MKYIQSAGGYCYKQYKNGKKVRISKRAYNKKIGGMKNQQQNQQQQNQQQQNQQCLDKQPKFTIGETVLCNSDICYQKFAKYLMQEGDYINFKPRNLTIKQIYCKGHPDFEKKRDNWKYLLFQRDSRLMNMTWKEEQKFWAKSDEWIIYEVKSDENTIANIEEKSLMKTREFSVTPLSIDKISSPVENEFAIFAHGSECVQKSEPVGRFKRSKNKIKLKGEIITEIYRPITDLYIKHIEKLIEIISNDDEIKVEVISRNKALLHNIIEYQIITILGSTKIFQDNFDDLPEFYTTENYKGAPEYYNVTHLIVKYDFTQKKEYKKDYNQFYPIFIKKMPKWSQLISSSPRNKNSKPSEKIEYLDLLTLIEIIQSSEDKYNFLGYFDDFMRNVKDKNVKMNEVENVFDIYQSSLSLYPLLRKYDFDSVVKGQMFCPVKMSRNKFEKLMKEVKVNIDKEFEKDMENKVLELKKMLTSYTRRRYNKVLRDIELYDNQSVIMKCDAGCTLFESTDSTASALIDDTVTGVETFLKKRIEIDLIFDEEELKNFCIFKNMVPNISLQCSENLNSNGKPQINFNYTGVFKLPVQFKEEDTPRRIFNEDWKDNDHQAPWEINIKGLKDLNEDGKPLHFYTNIKKHESSKDPHTTLEKIIKEIRTNYGEKTPFRIFLSACRSSSCTTVDTLKRRGWLDGGLKKKVKRKQEKVKKGGLKKKVKRKKEKVKKGALKKKVKAKKAKVTAKKVRKSKKN